MKAPKILPWIARKTGISDELALKLWRRAAGEAAQLTGEIDGSEYWGLATERFIELAEEESNNPLVFGTPGNLAPAPHLTWMWRHQSRLSLLSLMAAQNAYRFWQHTWQNLYLPQKAA
jgi:hypothetical protein